MTDIVGAASGFKNNLFSGKFPSNPLGLKQRLEKSGRFPPIELIIHPLGTPRRISLNRFTEYSFNSSIMVPVDTFSFKFVAPDDPRPISSIIRSGDIATLHGNNLPLSTGIIDQVEVEVTEAGEIVSITGRDLLSQYEDNMTVDFSTNPIYAQALNISGVLKKLNEGTRINKIKTQDAPSSAYLFATEPGETKLAALQRYIEPLNILVWMSPTGEVVAGRPNFSQGSRGRLVLSKTKRLSNVMSMRSIRATTRIPNILTPIFSGQEEVVARVSKEQSLFNEFSEPKRLRNNQHVVSRVTVVSMPQGSSAQDLAEVNAIRAGGGNILQAYAKREMARANVNDLIVQTVVAGHYNELGEPYAPDTVYKIEFDRDGINKEMYLYEVEYRGGESEGQRTILTFTQKFTMVGDTRAL